MFAFLMNIWVNYTFYKVIFKCLYWFLTIFNIINRIFYGGGAYFYMLNSNKWHFTLSQRLVISFLKNSKILNKHFDWKPSLHSYYYTITLNIKTYYSEKYSKYFLSSHIFYITRKKVNLVYFWISRFKRWLFRCNLKCTFDIAW